MLVKPTPNEIAILAHEIGRVFGTMEDWLVREIVERLIEGAPDLPAEVSEWRIEKLLASAQFSREAKAKMREILERIPPQVEKQLYSVIKATVETGDRAVLEAAFEQGMIASIPSPGSAVRTSFWIEKLQEQALHALNLVNTSMLTSAQQGYIDTLNRAAGLVAEGESPRAAVRYATKQLAKDGLTGFVDRAGRRWEPQSAVEMIIRTTWNNAANQAAFTQLEAMGCDVILVSAHMGARPKCSLVQGKLFSLSGSTESVKDKHGASHAVGDWTRTSYGEPDGILGINCRHHIGAFFDGLSVNETEEIDEEENRERYKREQEQRKLERELRKIKRERDVANASGDREEYLKQHRRARAKSQQLRDHIEEHSLRRSKVRERYITLR